MITRLCILVLLPFLASTVKRGDFKTCDQSAFCKQHRAISANTGYAVVPGTAKHAGSVFRATLKNEQNELELRIISLKDASLRIQIDELAENSIRKRFVPNDALNGVPQEVDFSNVEVKSDSAIVTSQNGVKAVVTFRPFMIEAYNSLGELFAQVNRDGKLKVEEFRPKEDGKEYPEGFWEESFSKWTDTKQFGSSSVGVDVSFVGYKHAYGLAEHADSFSLRTTVGNTDPYRLYNLDVFEYELNNPMSLYVAIPYLVAQKANRTAGMLWLNAAETWIDTSSSASAKGMFRSLINSVLPDDTVPHFDAHFMSETGLVDIFLFSGPSPKDVHNQYSTITGVTPLPPMFAIGYHQCRWNYNDELDVANVNENFDKYDIPMDVIWLDIEHTDGKKYFTWDQHKFAHPTKMIDDVASKGRKMVTIIDPHIKKDDSYRVYKDAKDLGLFVKKSDGTTDFSGHCWPGESEYLDFLNPETRKYWAAQFAFDRYVGSTPNLFTWNDMNEPSVFSGPEVTMDKSSMHYGQIEHREVHNMYGFYQHSTTFEGQMQRTNGRDRPFILTRSGFVGTQRTAAIWTGDNAAEWSHLAIAAPMLLSLSVSGVPFVGADVGGFFGNPDEQLLTRWYQAGAFQPFFRAHAHIDTKRREPWLMSEDTRLRIRTAIRRRYALLPFWYTLFREHTQTGVPPMRPLFYVFPEKEEFFEEHNSWMVGNALLVRPVTEKDATSVNVDLPGAWPWYDWETGKYFAAGAHSVNAPIDHIPVFQKGGTIVPTWQRIRRAASLMVNDPLTLFVALCNKGNADGEVYTDDGKTHDYKDDSKFAHAMFKYTTVNATNGELRGWPAADNGKFETDMWIERVEIRGVKQQPQSVNIIRESDPTAELEFSYDRDLHILVVRKPLVGINQEFTINVHF